MYLERLSYDALKRVIAKVVDEKIETVNNVEFENFMGERSEDLFSLNIDFAIKNGIFNSDVAKKGNVKLMDYFVFVEYDGKKYDKLDSEKVSKYRQAMIDELKLISPKLVKEYKKDCGFETNKIEENENTL